MCVLGKDVKQIKISHLDRNRIFWLIKLMMRVLFMSYVFRKYVLFAAMNLPICILPMNTCLLCQPQFENLIFNGKHPCTTLISTPAKTLNTFVFSTLVIELRHYMYHSADLSLCFCICKNQVFT